MSTNFMRRCAMAAFLGLGITTVSLAQNSGWMVHTMPAGHRVEALCIDSSNNVWSAGHAGVATFDWNQATVNFTGGWVIGLAATGEGVFAASNNGIMLHSGGAWSDPVNAGSPWISPLAADRTGGIWMFTPINNAPMVKRFDGNDFQIFHDDNTGFRFSNHLVASIAPAAERVYFATDTGLVIYSMNDGVWSHMHRGNSGIASSSLTALATAPDGTLWLLSRNERKLMSYDGTEWRSWPLQRTPMSGLAVDSRGNVWLADEENLLAFDGTTIREIPLPNAEFRSAPERLIAIDRQDRVVVGVTATTGSRAAFLGIYTGGVSSAETRGDEEPGFALSAVPNPATSGTSVQLSLQRSDDVTVELYDMLGERVAVLYQGRLPGGRHSFDADLGDLPRGAYHIHARVGAWERDLRVIVR